MFYIRATIVKSPGGSLIPQSRVHHLSKPNCLVPIFSSVSILQAVFSSKRHITNKIICPYNVIQQPNNRRVTTRGNSDALSTSPVEVMATRVITKYSKLTKTLITIYSEETARMERRFNLGLKSLITIARHEQLPMAQSTSPK